MDINNNQQINTFTEGMNTDTSDSMIKESQYRFAKNLRLVTDTDSNSGELRVIEGMSQILDGFENTIATTQIRDIAVVIDQTSKGLEIWKIQNGEKILLFGPCKELIPDSLSLATRYEDDDNIKLYIADGKHAMMYINVAPVPDPKHVETDISKISTTTEHTFGGFSNFIKISGTLKPAVVQYAYVLYNKYGNSSQLSPLSNPQVIAKDKEGFRAEINSTIGFSFTINENKNSGYNKIKVYRITYQEVGQDPTVELIVDDYLNQGSNKTVIDSGLSAISTLSVSEFLALQKIVLIPKEIESKNNYLFASNVSYQIQETSDVLNWFYDDDNFSAMTDGQQNNLDLQTNYDSSVWGKTDAAIAAGRSTNGFISWKLLQTYDSQITSKKTLRHDEIYRYGIVLYDKYGTAWPVRWVVDLRTPPISKSNELIHYINGMPWYTNLHVKFTISKSNTVPNYFTAYEIVRCNRTINDRATITQGIIGRPLQGYEYEIKDANTNWPGIETSGNNTATQYLTASGYMTPTRMVVYNRQEIDNNFTYDHKQREDYDRFAISSDDTVLFSSPEYCYQDDDVYNIMQQSSQFIIKPVVQYFVNNVAVESKDDDGNSLNQYRTGGDIAYSWFLGRLTGYWEEKSEISWVHRIKSRHYEENGTAKELDVDAVYMPTWYYLWMSPYDETNTTPQTKESYGYTRNTIFNYITPIIDESVRYSDFDDVKDANWEIQEVKKVNVPEWNQFTNSEALTFSNASTTIGGKDFVGWSTPILAGLIHTEDVLKALDGGPGDFGGDLFYKDDNHWKFNGLLENNFFHPIGAVGKSMIMKLRNNVFSNQTTINASEAMNILICNVRRASVQPYGGFDTYHRTNSTYYSHGYYSNLDTETTMDVYDGDCYVQNFYYNALKTWYSSDAKYAPNMSTVYVVPLETDIDIIHDFGSTYDEIQSRYIQDLPAELRGYVQTKSAYLYNTAYGSDTTARPFTGSDKEDATNVDYDYRVHYSDIKENNENIDSWQNFKSANYIDVDTRYGKITNLRLFKDTLLFWQENATGVLSVNERTLLQDVNDTNIILGNGDVLQRYDYITTEYGMKPNHHADGQSNTTLYWWDGYRKDILAYAGGQQVIPMKKVKTISNYINKNDEVEHPVIAYDVKYDEMLMSIVGTNPIAYSEIAQQFIAEYETPFKHKINLSNQLLLADSEKVYKWNENQTNLLPSIKYVVNKDSMYNKVFDITTFGGRFYGGETSDLTPLRFTFRTPLKQESRMEDGSKSITNREYDYRLTIPRAGKIKDGKWITEDWGDRMRGKTMECEFSSTSPDKDFSLQYITTKFRMSWT